MKYDHELEFARRTVELAGENAVQIRRSGISAEMKEDSTPVTRADRDNEALIRQRIESEFPEDGILGEEGSQKEAIGTRRWIFDPIDGTRDFLRGTRFWCVLMALEEEAQIKVGVAHFPLLQETYWAVRGSGAYLNGVRIRASEIDDLRASAFSPNGLYLPEARQYLPRIMELMQNSWAVRSYGGSLDACMLAAGKVEIWFKPKAEVWDLAPMKIIIEESGGAFLALDGSQRIDRGSALGCAPGVLDKVCHALGIQRAVKEL